MGMTCINTQPISITNQILSKNVKAIDNCPFLNIPNQKTQKQQKKWWLLCCDEQNNACSQHEELCVSEVGITGNLEDQEQKRDLKMRIQKNSRACFPQNIETSFHFQSPCQSQNNQTQKAPQSKYIHHITTSSKSFPKPSSLQKPRQTLHDFHSDDLDIRKTFVTERQICGNLKQKRYQGTLSVISEIDSMGSVGLERSSQNLFGHTKRLNKPTSMSSTSQQIK